VKRRVRTPALLLIGLVPVWFAEWYTPLLGKLLVSVAVACWFYIGLILG
jgi:hypothetical protein